MVSHEDKFNILIVGATGELGSLITEHCLTKPNLIVNIFIRNLHKNKELISQVKKAGGKVFKGDLLQPDTFKDVTKGMHTVIFSLPSFDMRVSIDGQIAMIDDCVANKVERVMPSEFGENYSKLSPEEIEHLPPVVAKLKVNDYLKTQPIKTLHINTGIFLESFFKIIIGQEFECWGDPNQKLQLTSYEDTAKFAAAAIARKDLTGNLTYVANEVTLNEIAAIYNKVRGTNIRPKMLGSLAELKVKCDDMENQRDCDPFMMRLCHFVFDERVKFDEVSACEFEEVKGTSLEEFLRERPDIEISN